jgi:CTP:phosphocholine cytidylyltransferase-like protein/thiamine kinase-like enzyme
MNAVIMAAGTASRFAPLSYEKPKGLLNVRGEVLIERQIRQLLEAGIQDIIVIVGYMADQFMYLKDKYGVKIVMNEDYNRYNNTSSLIRIVEELGETYLCSSDNYFAHNVFVGKPKESFYSALYAEGHTTEYCLTTDGDDNITDVNIGGCNAWYMLGHVFFNADFSEKFRKILKQEYEQIETKLGYWEDVYAKHINDLPHMKIHRYQKHEIEEFDSLEELQQFDETYVNNTGCKMFQNICRILKCEERDICEIDVLKKGMTNCSFAFSCRKDKKKYVYRHPGVGTDKFINRRNECSSLQIAKDFGLDNTFVYMHPSEGWKISKFIDHAETLTASTIQQSDNLNQISHIYHVLHHLPIQMEKEFNIFREIEKYDAVISKMKVPMYDGWDRLRTRVLSLEERLQKMGIELCPCHNDAVSENFIKGLDGNISLIDWEYSGMNDPMADFAALFLENNFSADSQEKFLSLYYNDAIPYGIYDKIHCYQVLWDFLWAQWTVIKESSGDDFGTYGANRFHRGQINLNRI